ncbi:bifunctional phosphopantothenoylcysteine decarboxylase/phosphopantothenate--cysteine ligase CoaBC [Sulfobacillus harzensis]|uniref:Coenzyme A biosynthesis bifunctional protein CoaBC n=1 Tax=Sulfobacillus harzensis TaxID=2729629 RepID=A0A7Y0L324_9FIRM|nr:bifunctional phosphopantothenoylcysteine decarboxylase/phosphopantothenate--cysteine ligase CoaBC [Sulfobacillus harzensis]NMP22401.1 bifunctional phosphopantothenoylcysteine decarboxylase/phosphopantothenate--cysteine ligase CoaBC [Sulfobacillus harzensis]
MRIIVGVAGGIAAYKACEVVSRLVKAGHSVRVVMTPAAAQFVAPLTFRALSGHAVGIEAADEPAGPLSHVQLAHWAEALVIAPATASLMSRLAHGQTDDLLGLVYLGIRGPVVAAPAMEPEMWSHPRTQANASVLRADGVRLVGPAVGRMASGQEGLGRMAEPAEIVAALEDALTPKDLAGTTIVVTAGATWEHFDPVRVLTNPSTGLMGVLIANQAARRGADVRLVTGPAVPYAVDDRVRRETVVSAEEMQRAVIAMAQDADVVVGAAAVSDFRPRERLGSKAHKDDVGLNWEMVRNPDIIQSIGERYQGQKVLVGFAAETEDVLAQAEAKRRKKHLDAVVANLVGVGRGFGAGEYGAWLVTAEGPRELGGSKEHTAAALLDWIRERRAAGHGHIG